MPKVNRKKTPKKRRTQFRKVSGDRLKAALIECDGGLAATGRLVGMTRQSVHARIAHNPELQELIADLGANLVDMAESAIAYQLRENHDRETAKYVLNSKGKDRGWGEQPILAPPPPDNSRRQTIIQTLVVMMNERAAAIHARPALVDITPKPNGHAPPMANGHAPDPTAQLLAAKKAIKR